MYIAARKSSSILRDISCETSKNARVLKEMKNINEPCYKIGDRVRDVDVNRYSKLLIIVDIISREKLQEIGAGARKEYGNYFYICEAEDKYDIGFINSAFKNLFPKNQACYGYLNLRIVNPPKYFSEIIS